MLNCRTKEEVAALLQNGMHSVDEKDRYGNTLLHRAVIIGNLDFIEYLLNSGFNARVKNINGETPIFYASRNKKAPEKKIVELFLEKVGPSIYTDFNKEGKNYFSK